MAAQSSTAFGARRVMALDIGEVRTGIALSDTAKKQATPLQVLDTRSICADNRQLRTLIADYQVDSVVVGLPLLGCGSEGSQARRTRSLAAKMLQGMDALCQETQQEMQHETPNEKAEGHGDDALLLTFFSERQSSKQAQQQGHSVGLTQRDMRGKLDSFAAAAFLQEYLDTMDNPHK
ncbi:MAG: Holliday junction resolvase RuvX [Coriobacteriia bacterium]|nr:Holliday junction resolvase RuvX [Coriobacteriia bacterium]